MESKIPRGDIECFQKTLEYREIYLSEGGATFSIGRMDNRYSPATGMRHTEINYQGTTYTGDCLVYPSKKGLYFFKDPYCLRNEELIVERISSLKLSQGEAIDKEIFEKRHQFLKLGDDVFIEVDTVKTWSDKHNTVWMVLDHDKSSPARSFHKWLCREESDGIIKPGRPITNRHLAMMVESELFVKNTNPGVKNRLLLAEILGEVKDPKKDSK